MTYRNRPRESNLDLAPIVVHVIKTLEASSDGRIGTLQNFLPPACRETMEGRFKRLSAAVKACGWQWVPEHMKWERTALADVLEANTPVRPAGSDGTITIYVRLGPHNNPASRLLTFQRPNDEAFSFEELRRHDLVPDGNQVVCCVREYVPDAFGTSINNSVEGSLLDALVEVEDHLVTWLESLGYNVELV